MAEYNESQINSNETERISAEQQRINNEAQRQTKETEREAREATRQSNESTRISEYNTFMADAQSEYNSFITNVENAEDERIANEQSRVQAEASRVNAENSRGIRLTELENDMTYAKMQSSTVTDAYKFTVDDDGMMPSLMTLNNIEGLSSIETNDRSKKYLVSTNIGTICTIDINGKNYAEDIVCIETPHGSECVIDGTNITVRRNTPYTDNITAYAHGLMSIPTLEDGKKYCVFCDDVEISNGGASAIELQSGNNTFTFGDNWNSLFLDTRTFNSMFVYDSKSFIMRLHCTIGSHVGEVTYKNLQIYEVKEMIVPDIQLNSLPNGVKDEIKDGMLIKRTNQVNLKDLAWVTSSTNGEANDYKVYYTHSVTDIKWTTDREVNPNTILCNMLPCTSNAGTGGANDTIAQYQTPGISSHVERSELRIKVKASDAPDLNSLYTWLNNNNVTAVYEMQSYKYEDVNLTIKADKGDTVVINTTKTMDLTYDIQLNTRAQIDVLQETVVHTVNEVTNELRDNIDDLKYELDYDQHGNGCYTLPGGLIIQFGYITYNANTYGDTIDFIITFPAPFPNQVISFMTSMSGGDNGWDSRVSGHALSNSQARVVIRGINNTIVNTMYWFAIGR